MIRDFVRRSTVGLLLLPPLLHSAWGATCPADVEAALNENQGFYNAPFYPARYSFAALKADGSIASWGNVSNGGENLPTDSGYISITPNAYAYAALKADGSISVWGNSNYGGSGEPSDNGYTSISSNHLAFAALKSDGSISSWGYSNYGGEGAPVDDGYVSIASTYFSFAALKADGSISSWGNSYNGVSDAPSDDGYVSISSGVSTFVARKADGSLVTWGDEDYYYGSGEYDVPDDNGYVSVSSSEGAFAALKADGSISAWGAAYNGGEGAPNDAGHVAISSNHLAFAALTADGSIHAWGNANYGGEGEPTDSGYVSIKSNAYAFAALKENGSISAWGGTSFGGEGAPTDSGYISISATNYAFAALKADGSITVWGDSNNGGVGAPVDNEYVSISSNQNAFAAMKADGSISAWGSASNGGDGAPTDIGYVSINNRALTGNSDCNVSPSITLSGSPDNNVVAGTAYSFAPEVENAALVISQSFSILNMPSWASFDTATGVLTGTPALTDVGTFSDITISVSNGFSSGQLPAFSITVVEPNATPTINTALADISTDEDVTFSYLVPADTFADADIDDTLVLSTSSLPDWLSFHSTTNTFSGTPEQGDIGAYSITIRATDTFGAYVEDTMIITVDNVNDAPTVATAVTDLRMDQGGTLSFEVPSDTFIDVDTGEVLTLSAIDLPSWLSFDETTATFSGTPGNAQVGSVTVTLRATDSSGLQVEDSFEIEVGNVNDAPTVANVVADQRTNEDAPFSLGIPDNTFADIDAGDVLNLSAGGLPDWLSFDDNSNTLSGTPAQADVGALSITLRATDIAGAFVEQDLIIRVINVNDAPTVANPIADQNTNEDAPFSYTVPANTFADVDPDDALTLTASSLPDWLSFDGDTRVLSGIPEQVDVGARTIKVRATDIAGAFVEESINITVVNVNDAPTVALAVNDQNIEQGDTYNFDVPDGTFADVDTGESLTLSAIDLPEWLSFDPETGTFSGSPGNEQVGTLTVTLQATDNSGALVQHSFEITIGNINDAPTVANAPADQRTNEDAPFSYTVPANTFADVDTNDTLSLTASDLPAWLNFDGDTGILSGTPAQANVGTQTVKVRATDIAGAFVEAALRITVVNTNDAPTIDNVVADLQTNEDALFSVVIPDNTFADVDAGDALTVSVAGLPDWLSFDENSNTLSGTPAQTDVGGQSIILRATDIAGAFVEQDLIIRVVNVNDAPTIANPLDDQRTNEDVPFRYTVPANTFADVDTNDTLTLTASVLPAWLNFASETGVLSGTPAQANVGIHTVKVRATDIAGAFAEESFTITVINVNDAPTVALAVIDQTIEQGGTLDFDVPDGTFADADTGESLTLSAIDLPEWLSFDPETGTFSGSPGNEQVGTLTVTLQATDSSGALVQHSFEITIDNINDAPTVANTLADQRTNEDASFSYTVLANTFADVDTGDILTLTASDLPEWLSFDDETGMLAGTPVQADVGTHTIKIRATDIADASVETTLRITVVNTNDAPSLASAVPNMLTNEDDLFSLEIPDNTFTDVDAGDELTLSVAGLPDWLSFDTSSNTLSGTPAQIDVGAHTITLRATDIAEAFVEQALTITVINVNDAPTVAIAVPAQTIEQDGAFSLEVPDGMFVDADTGESLILSAIDLPDWLSFDPETGTFSGTPGNDQVGTVTVTLQATDSSGAVVQHSFDIIVGNVNDAPILIVAPTDQVVDENTAFNYTLPSNTFIDPDVGDSLTLSATDLPAWLSFNPGSAIFSGTPAQADVGTTTITVQASDVDGLSAQGSFELVVNDINNMAPEFSSGDSLEVAENSSGVIHQIVVTDVDTDDIISLTIGGDDAAQFQFDATTGELSLSQGLDQEAPTDANADGVYQLSVRAEDLAGNNASQDVSVTVVDVDEAPVLTVQTLQIDEFAEVGTLLGTLTAHDPEEGSLQWSLLDQNSPFVLNESGELSLAAALDFETIAAYELNVQVDDGLFSTSGIVQVQVTDATAEQATIWLQLEQDDHQVQQIRADGGPVSVTAVVGNPIPGLVTAHDWAQSSQAVLDRSISIDSEGETLEFSASGLSSGDELVAHVVVTRDGVDSEDTLKMQVVASSTTVEQTVDGDGDGILDIYEGDLDATADATTANKLQTVRGDDLSHVMESEEGTFLRLGSVARSALSDQSRIEIEDLMASLSVEAVNIVTDTLPDGDVENVEELFDFEVANLAAVGDSVRVVLPLQTALTAGAQYMKFHPVTGWRSFEIDAANGINSAPALAGIEGQCLPPGSEGWSEGLTEGHLCIELRIEDGGVNDADSYDELGNRPAGLGLNGNVKDPGAVINSASEPEVPPIGPATPDTDNPPITPVGEDIDTDGVIKVATRGSGHTGLWLLAILIGFLGSRMGLRRRVGGQRGVEFARQRWIIRCAGLGLLALLLSGGAQAGDPQSAYLVLGSGISSLEPDVSDSPVELADDSSQAYWWAMGYRFNSRWQGEVEYMDLGSAGLRPGGALSYTDVNVSALFDVWRTTLFGSRSDLSLFARFGVGRLDARSGTGQRVEKQSHAQFIIGGGLEFSLTNHILLRAEVTSYDEDASRFGLSAVLLLGP